jgi:hypothetical protein
MKPGLLPQAWATCPMSRASCFPGSGYRSPEWKLRRRSVRKAASSLTSHITSACWVLRFCPFCPSNYLLPHTTIVAWYSSAYPWHVLHIWTISFYLFFLPLGSVLSHPSQKPHGIVKSAGLAYDQMKSNAALLPTSQATLGKLFSLKSFTICELEITLQNSLSCDGLMS